MRMTCLPGIRSNQKWQQSSANSPAAEALNNSCEKIFLVLTAQQITTIHSEMIKQQSRVGRSTRGSINHSETVG